MTYIIAGLGNPGDEYEGTRHNTGRMMLFAVAKALGIGGIGKGTDSVEGFTLDKKVKALTATKEKTTGKLKEKILLVAPETFMNNSGKAIGPLIVKGAGSTTQGKPNLKAAEKLIVVYDDFNLPLGSIRVSWNRSSGGHNGLESIIKAVKTEAFVRIRVGTAPAKANGTAKVPHGDKDIEKFILSKFKPAEEATLKNVAKRVVGAVETIISEGREKAMSIYNAG